MLERFTPPPAKPYIRRVSKIIVHYHSYPFLHIFRSANLTSMEAEIIQPCPQLGDKADIQRVLTDGLLEALPHVMVHYDVQKQAIVEFGW